jgi:hypothetical protein
METSWLVATALLLPPVWGWLVHYVWMRLRPARGGDRLLAAGDRTRHPVRAVDYQI